MMTCQCEVCVTVAGLKLHHLTESVVAQLPPTVQRILAAQQRVRSGHPQAGDEELVQAAASRCSAGRFAKVTTEH